MLVLTGGKFNRMHKGHVWLLKKAKKLGYLVVVLANDFNNKRVYAIPARKRKRAVEELKIADKIVIGDKKKFVAVIKKYKPNIIVLGYDQKLPNGTKEYVKNCKIKVVKFKKHGNYSTRRL